MRIDFYKLPMLHCIYNLITRVYIMDSTTINLRLPSDLKNAFELVAKSKDLTSSQMLRHYMRFEVENYMKNNAQQKLKGVK